MSVVRPINRYMNIFVFVTQREAKVELLREAVDAHTQLTEQVNTK